MTLISSTSTPKVLSPNGAAVASAAPAHLNVTIAAQQVPRNNSAPAPEIPQAPAHSAHAKRAPMKNATSGERGLLRPASRYPTASPTPSAAEPRHAYLAKASAKAPASSTALSPQQLPSATHAPEQLEKLAPQSAVQPTGAKSPQLTPTGNKALAPAEQVTAPSGAAADRPLSVSPQLEAQVPASAEAPMAATGPLQAAAPAAQRLPAELQQALETPTAAASLLAGHLAASARFLQSDAAAASAPSPTPAPAADIPVMAAAKVPAIAPAAASLAAAPEATPSAGVAGASPHGALQVALAQPATTMPSPDANAPAQASRVGGFGGTLAADGLITGPRQAIRVVQAAVVPKLAPSPQPEEQSTPQETGGSQAPLPGQLPFLLNVPAVMAAEAPAKAAAAQTPPATTVPANTNDDQGGVPSSAESPGVLLVTAGAPLAASAAVPAPAEAPSRAAEGVPSPAPSAQAPAPLEGPFSVKGALPSSTAAFFSAGVLDQDAASPEGSRLIAVSLSKSAALTTQLYRTAPDGGLVQLQEAVSAAYAPAPASASEAVTATLALAAAAAPSAAALVAAEAPTATDILSQVPGLAPGHGVLAPPAPQGPYLTRPSQGVQPPADASAPASAPAAYGADREARPPQVAPAAGYRGVELLGHGAYSYSKAADTHASPVAYAPAQLLQAYGAETLAAQPSISAQAGSPIPSQPPADVAVRIGAQLPPALAPAAAADETPAPAPHITAR